MARRHDPPRWQQGRHARRPARGRCALYVAHTNADVARPGVSDALAKALELKNIRILAVQDERLDQWVVHVPRTHTERLLDAVGAAGAGQLGHYERCAFITPGEGTFTPREGAVPFVGSVGRVERVDEDRVELVARPARREQIAAALRSAHPYEEPSFTVTSTVTPSRRGLGRMGELPETLTLQAFTAHVADRLPATAAGVRASGDPETPVRTVAVAGGACLQLADTAAAAGAQVFVTSDAKHHSAQEAPLPIVDVPHWAGEWPWTADVAGRLRAAFPAVEVTVSDLVTDPWTLRAPDRVDTTS